MDTGIVPLGERALRSILDHFVAVGDEAETSYLEIKSELDLTIGPGVAKVAKFLLGAANRRPREAARHFRGHAVLVIGAQKGRARGVQRGVEAHELEDRLRPYLGPQFPAFEFGRIGVDDDREVLFVIAQPPQDGQIIFPCHKPFQGQHRRDNLDDGAIYVRGGSNTRPARSGEVLALVERARGGGRPVVDLAVELVGPVNRVQGVDELMQSLYDFEEAEFSKPPEPGSAMSLEVLALPGLYGTVQPPPPEQRARRLNAWRRDRSANVVKGREHFLGVGLPGMGVRVTSRDRFVAGPRLVLTFHGCEALDYADAGKADWSKVVEPVVKPQRPYGLAPMPDFSYLRPRGYPVDWGNRGDDAEVVLTPKSLRPNTPWTSDADDYVLIARDPEASEISVTWSLTEDGGDAVTTNELLVTTGQPVDAAHLFKEAFIGDM